MTDEVRAHLASLKAKTWFVRSEAAEALGKIGDAEAIEALIDALRDESRWVRIAAREALEKLDRHWFRHSAAGRHVPSFMAELRSEDAEIRREALEILGRIGDARAVAPIIAALRDPDLAVRRSAAAALEDIEPNWLRTAAALQQLPEFIAALRDPDPEVRGSAAAILRNMAPHWPQTEAARQQVPEFTAALKQPDLRLAALEALGKIGDAHATTPIIDMLRIPDDALRQAAAAALQSLGRVSVEPLIAALTDQDQDVRAHAAAVLHSIDPHWPRQEAALRRVPALMGALLEMSGPVQRAAAETLGNIGDARAVEPLIALLQQADSEVLPSVAEALGKLHDPAATGPLLPLLGHEEAGVRYAAISALRMIGDAGAIEPLIDLLGDADARVRGEVSDTLANAGQIALEPLVVALQHKDSAVRETVPAVLAQIDPHWPQSRAAQRHQTGFIAALGHPDPHLQFSAAMALGQLGDGRAVMPLIAALGYDGLSGSSDGKAGTARNSSVRCAAATALGLIGNIRAVRPLVGALENPTEDRGVRCAAATALGQIGDTRAVMPLIAAARLGTAWQVQNAAEEALVSLGPIILEPIVAALRGEGKLARPEALEHLRQFESRWLAPLLESYPHLLCSHCGQRAQRYRVRIGWLRWKTLVACRRCGRLYALVSGIRRVMGVLGGEGEEFWREGDTAYFRLWSEAGGSARNADIDALVIRNGGVADYGKAIQAVIDKLTGDNTRSARWHRKIPVLLEGGPPLEPGALAKLREVFGEVL